ncbi:F-box/WD repeat-containing protein 2-like [Argonauta hians]
MALNYNNDDDLLASGSDDRSVSIWDFKTCEGLFLRQPKTVSAVKLIKNRVFVSFFDGAIHSFNIPDNVILQYIGHVSAVYAIDLCEQLSILVSGSADLTVKTWDLHTGQLLTTFAGQHQHWITETRIILNADESYTVISCNNRSCFVRRMDLEHEELYIKRISWENYTIVPHLFVESGNLLKICFQSDDNKDAFIGVYQLQSEVNLVHQYKIAETVKPIQLLLSIGQKLVMAISRGDQYRILYIFGLHSKEVILSKPLPPIRLTHNGSSVVCGPSEWLNGFDVIPPHGLVLAAALQNHIIYSLHWK